MFGKEWVDGAGTLYCLDKSMTLHPRIPGTTISNGLVRARYPGGGWGEGWGREGGREEEGVGLAGAHAIPRAAPTLVHSAYVYKWLHQ
jgi:hypothetical protein